MYTITNRILKWRVRGLTFPKLSPVKYNNLWEISHRTFKNLNLIEFIKIFKNLIIDNYSFNSLLTISTIVLIIKRSRILEEKDTESNLKLFKALNTENNKVDLFLKYSMVFSLFWRIINFFFNLFWIPLKLAILFYILDYLNYDISYLYHKLNNLSLGILDLYYRTLIDFLESIIIKYDFYKLDNAIN